MKINRMKFTGIAVALIGVVSLIGCDNAPTAAEVGQKTGAALDKAADKTVDVKKTAVKTTGEALQKAGTAVENTGGEMPQ